MKIKLLFIILITFCFNTISAEEETLAAPELAEKLIVRAIETQDLPASILNVINQYKIPPENISLLVQDVNADSPLIAHNIEILRSPASTMKLVTTYAALKTLAPSYSWQTEAWTRGVLEKGILKGDLVLKGYGDPFLVHERYWKFIHDLKSKGLREIRGDIIIDNSFFDVPYIDTGAFDNEPHRIYNAPPSALMFNFQATRFLFQPDKDKKQVSITPFPWIPGLSLLNKVQLTNGGCKKAHYRPRFKTSADKSFSVSGSYSHRCGQQFILRHVSSPEEHAYNAFVQLWQELGGKLSGQLKTGTVDQASDQLLHRYASPTLGEQIRLINKWSNNVIM